MARAQAGDMAATEAVLRRFQPIARGIASSFFSFGADRDDVTQEALIAVLSAVDSYRPAAAPRGFDWFVRLVIRRKLVSYVVKAPRAGKHKLLNEAVRVGRDEQGRLVPALELCADPHSDPADVLLRREQVRALVAAIATLSDRERAALAHVAAGEAYVNDKSTDNAVQRARKKLKAAASPGAAT